MTEVEVAIRIVKNNGDCLPFNINCDDCPANRIYKEKGLDYCSILWNFDVYKRIEWFESWLSENKQSECKVVVNDNIEEKLDKIIKLLEGIKNEN